MSVPDFTDLTLDRAQPLQAQLYRMLVQRICSGRLSTGSKLPSSRRMSASLGVSRNTITQVLEQLKAEGFLTSRSGQGVFVCASLPPHVEAPSE
ncbi:winged helix-turn-helix domain-containing protein [Microbulbifer sp. MLAF003]|uniref:winged helix-turn-helix domain-containing protein n=1 Tax=Microbulbifer sp. MLAF003 TaxID=3032582 RepID=UPI0024AD0AAC|nr:winged helix-turn-helix domain-containing protein [Microbulbifer sp. MLAF003]WHI52068.1 winged helix-turn-helix domain-containing protein [Microbulbifer sp. MLAF003]